MEFVLDVPRNLPLSFIKIGSVTAKIILIWTNFMRTNVAWTNVALTDVTLTDVTLTDVTLTDVTLTVGICSKCSQEPTFKVSSKSGQ